MGAGKAMLFWAVSLRRRTSYTAAHGAWSYRARGLQRRSSNFSWGGNSLGGRLGARQSSKDLAWCLQGCAVTPLQCCNAHSVGSVVLRIGFRATLAPKRIFNCAVEDVQVFPSSESTSKLQAVHPAVVAPNTASSTRIHPPGFKSPNSKISVPSKS